MIPYLSEIHHELGKVLINWATKSRIEFLIKLSVTRIVITRI